MKLCYRIFMLLFCTFAVIAFPQIYQPKVGIPHSSGQYPDTSIKRPDYRNHINLPEYDPSLMPLKTVQTGTGVWTELNPKVPRVDYLGIHFINKDTGWACGANGTLIKSTDGGESWLNINSQTTTPILKVRSFNGAVVIASGYNGLILHSTDGGETFTQVASGVNGDLWGLQMLNDTLGWACGTANSLIKTTDGGLTWQRIFTPSYTSDYWWIDFFTESYGFIAANGNVLRTTDGGTNWEVLQAGDSAPLFCLDVIDSLHIAAAGYGGTSYPAKNIYSSDGGNTWINGGTLNLESVNCIQYVNPDTGYLVMTNVSARKTTNRGQEWTPIGGISDNYELQFLKDMSGKIGYSAGTALNIFKAEGNLDSWRKLIINENFTDVFFVSAEKGFAISSGPYGQLFKTEDSGVSWEIVSGAPGGNDIVFTDDAIGFIGTTYTGDVDQVRIYKTINGGVNWYVTNTSDTIGTVYKIFFTNQTTGWAATGWSPGTKGKILKTTDGGENWFEQLEDLSIDSFTSIYFIDSLNGWATSRYIWQTTNGGTNWIQRTDVQLYFNRNIYFTSIDTGFVTVDMTNTGSHDLYKTTNGGISWQRETRIETSYNIHAFPNKYHWISNGWSMGQVFETTDNGNSWEEISGELPAIFGQFHSPIEYIGYAVSGYGLILKYFDTTYVPVELTQLTARYSLNKIELNWSTASEVNNYGFEIWKSSDLQNWEKIGFLHGAGTSTEIRNYSFSDFKIESEQLHYKIKQIDFDGSNKFSEVVSIQILVNNFVLTQNYPNPANPHTNISFTVPQRTSVKIELFSMTGEKIKEILNEEKERGIYSIEIDLKKYASGIYYYRMTTKSGYTATKKLILIK